MKKFVLFAALAASVGLMTSCSTDDEFTFPPGCNSGTIVFATINNSSVTMQTRSAESINSLNQFVVSAVNDDNTSYFSSEEFVFDGSTGVFGSQTSHYWPTTGTLSFYAINHPGALSVTDKFVPMYSYSDWDAEKDLVAATVLSGEKSIPYPLSFQHLTSQVYVSAEAADKSEELTYKLVSVEMSSPCDGTYNFADATGGVGTWTIDNASAKEYSYEDAFPQSFNKSGMATSGTTYWNILPVKDGKIRFKVAYQVFQNSRMIADYSGDNAKECIVNSPGLVSGKRYVYNFRLTRGTNEVITFSTSINDWNDAEDPFIQNLPDDDETDPVVTTPKPTAGSTSTITTVEGVDLDESGEYDWNSIYTSDEIALLSINTPSSYLEENKFNYAEVEVDGILYTVKVIDYYFEPIKTDNGDTIEIRIGTNKWYVNCCGENYMMKSKSSHTVRFVGCIIDGVSYSIVCD